MIYIKKKKKSGLGTSLVVQWLRCHTPNEGGPGSIRGQGTRSRKPQLRVCIRQPKSWYAAIRPSAAKLTK